MYRMFSLKGDGLIQVEVPNEVAADMPNIRGFDSSSLTSSELPGHRSG
jgi:hypothetical protein